MSSKLENIWYYYKYYIIGGIVALIAIAFAVGSCVNRGTYDVNILYMTHDFVDVNRQFDALFDTYMSDVNGDGKANTQVITISYGTTLNEMQSAGAARSANLAAGKNILFLCDEQNYNELKAGGFLMDISHLGQSQYLSQDRFDASSSGMLESIEGIKNSKSKYYFCIRTYDEKKGQTDKKYAAQYEAAYTFMKNVIEKHK